MSGEDQYFFLKGIHHEVEAGLEKRGFKRGSIGLDSIASAVKKWQGLSYNWDEEGVREGNVEHLVRQFARILTRHKLNRSENVHLPAIPAPSAERLDPRHAVAYVTVDLRRFPEVDKLIQAARTRFWNGAEPPFPWIDFGLKGAKIQAEAWLEMHGVVKSAHAIRMEIPLVTEDQAAFNLKIQEMGNQLADDPNYQTDGLSITELTQHLTSMCNLSGVYARIEQYEAFGEQSSSLPLKVTHAGPNLKLPGNSFKYPVPISGPLADLYRLVTAISAASPWWDREQALEYLMTGHPPLPDLDADIVRLPGTGRRRKTLTLRHVALLELRYRLPNENWQTLLGTFNKWCVEVLGLKPFMGANAQQIMRKEHQRAVHRALDFLYFVRPSINRFAD